MLELAGANCDENVKPRKSIDISFLNQYSDAMRDDVRRVVREVLDIVPDAYLVEQLEPRIDEDTGDVFFDGDGEIDCDVVSGFVNLMSRRLSDDLRFDISNLRTQYSGLNYYFAKMCALSRGNGFSEGLGIIQEMESCEKFGIPIKPNKLIIDSWMCSVSSFEEAKYIYEYVISGGFYDLDTVFFQLWRCSCVESSQVGEVFSAARLAGVSENFINEIDLENGSCS